LTDRSEAPAGPKASRMAAQEGTMLRTKKTAIKAAVCPPLNRAVNPDCRIFPATCSPYPILHFDVKGLFMILSGVGKQVCFAFIVPCQNIFPGGVIHTEVD